MNIRQAQSSDYKKIIPLYNGFVGSDRYSKFGSDSFEKVLNSTSNFIFVVEDRDKLVGFASFSVRLVVRYAKPIAELDEIYVLPEYRKKGVGKLLMNEVLKKAKKLNCYRLFIESHYDHKVAHNFYQKLGFTNYGYHFIKNL